MSTGQGKPKYSIKLVGLAFLFGVLALAGFLVNAPLIWRVVNALAWFVIGYLLFKYRKGD